MARQFTYDKERFLDLLKRRGIQDQAVLTAMQEVPRENFVGTDLKAFAYDDSPLPIEEGQTISQPFIVAWMTEALQLKPDSKALEIGTGSGYAAAILSRIAREVYSVERHQKLADLARERFRQSHYDNVWVRCGDGTLGWPEHAPYDGIVVTAGSPEAPRALIEQLKIGGRLVIPAGRAPETQTLQRITRISTEEVETEDLGAVRFVPLIGDQGWQEVAGRMQPTPKK